MPRSVEEGNTRSSNEDVVFPDTLRRKRTYRGCDGSGDVEDNTHDGVEVQHHEHRRNQVCDESVRHAVSPPCSSALETKCSRNEKVNQAVLEQHVHELRALCARLAKLDGGKDEDDEIEAHGINEGSCENCRIGVCDGTSLARDPLGL